MCSIERAARVVHVVRCEDGWSFAVLRFIAQGFLASGLGCMALAVFLQLKGSLKSGARIG